MVCLDCLPDIVLGPLLNTLIHIEKKRMVLIKPSSLTLSMKADMYIKFNSVKTTSYPFLSSIRTTPNNFFISFNKSECFLFFIIKGNMSFTRRFHRSVICAARIFTIHLKIAICVTVVTDIYAPVIIRSVYT